MEKLTDETKSVRLNDKTYVSLGLIAGFGGFIGWLTNIYHLSQSNYKEIQEVKREVKENKAVFMLIEGRLSTIEGKLDIILTEKKDPR